MTVSAGRLMTIQEAVSQIKNGDTIGIGGWSMERKPMALVREIARSKLKDLTVLSFSGVDLDLLIGMGKVKKAVYPFCIFEGGATLLGQPYNFRRARQEGSIEFMELSEQTFWHGLQAAAERMPFYPTISGLGSDVLTMSPDIKLVKSPYGPGEFVAMPPLATDVALIQVNVADPTGNGAILGEPFFDKLFAHGSKKTILCAHKVVPFEKLRKHYDDVVITRMWVAGVVETPYGAHPTHCYPDHAWDTEHMGEYVAAARDPEAWKAYVDKYITGPKTQAAYTKLVGGKSRLSQLK